MKTSIYLSTLSFLRALVFVKRAMGRECAQHYRQLLIRTDGKEATLACTDGHRMHLAKFACEDAPFDVCVPDSLVNFLEDKIALLVPSGSDGFLGIEGDEKSILLSIDAYDSKKKKQVKHWICTYPISDPFSDIERLLASIKPVVTFMCTTKALRTACTGASVEFKVVDGKVYLGTHALASTENEPIFDFAVLDAFNHVEIRHDASTVVRLNSLYTLEAAKSALGICVSLADSLSPVVFERHGKAEYGIKEFAYVMPVRR